MTTYAVSFHHTPDTGRVGPCVIMIDAPSVLHALEKFRDMHPRTPCVVDSVRPKEDGQHIRDMRRKAEAFDAIADILYPEEAPQSEWTGDTIEFVAETILDLMPGAVDGDRTLADDAPARR